jgi:Uma2 family endonuclease
MPVLLRGGARSAILPPMLQSSAVAVAMGSPPMPGMTLAEWADASEDEPGELVDGALVEDEDVGYRHDLVGAWLTHLLFAWVVPLGGLVALSDARFGVGPRRGRKADVSVYFHGRKPPTDGLVTVPPDIMVEVISPRPKDARRDRVEKMNEYAAFGVKFYWLVDPALRTLEIFELGADGRYARAVGAIEGAVCSVPGCEGLSIDLDALWALVDRIEAD